MDITFQYMKKRLFFGRQPLFCEAGPEMCDNIPVNVAEHKKFILRNPVHQLTQNTPNFSEHYINTIRAEYSTSGANHAEGGWPKDIHIADPEATQRYRRKVEKDDGYINCIMNLSGGMEHYIYQNNAIDMYHSYYAAMPSMPELERTSVRTVNVYRDPSRRSISAISWQPEHGHKFAVCYADVDFYRNSLKRNHGYVWDVENANSPESVLLPAAPMFDCKFCPRDVNLLVGGIATGQVVLFDRRLRGTPVGSCPPHVSHRDIVRKVIFIYTKSGSEFFSSGPDGVCKWWDLRNLQNYTDEMIMDVVKTSNDEQSMVTACGVCALEYEPTIPTRFMVGTEDGQVIGGNRKGKTPSEKLPNVYKAHTGPVWSLQRNPSFPKNFLTVGDWTMKVWSEECRDSPVLWSAATRHRITCAEWSPTRLSLMVLCGADGKISLWDILRRQHEPTMTMQLSPVPLTAQSFHEQGSLNAVGSARGYIFLVEFSHCLVNSDKYDKPLLTSMFERESKREKILEARLREIKLKMRQAEEGSAPTSLTDIDPTLGDRDLAEATNDFMVQVRKELTNF